MKTRITLLLFVLAAFFTKQSHAQAYQVPNGSFEQWDSVSGQPLYPTGWSSYESIFRIPLGLATQDTGIVGNYSVKLVSDTSPYYSGTFSGIISLGDGVNDNNIPTFSGIPFAYRPDTLFFAFKYSSPGVDTPFLNFQLTNKDTDVLAAYATLPALANWTLEYLTLDQYYISSQTPDTLIVQFFSSFNAPVIGSTLHVDDVYFGYINLPSAIQEVVDKLSLSIYPNPTSNIINISAAQDITGYKMLITDINGSLVDIITLTGARSSVDVSRYASGTYVYRVADKQGNIFTQDKFIVAR